MKPWIKWIGYRLRGSEIKAKAARGSVALGLGTVFQRVLRLLRIMVLARLLVPDDFGVAAITIMAVALSEAITDAGVKIAIIQNKDGANYSYLNAAWWFQVVRGLALFFATLILSPYVAAFYENPILTDLLRVSFLSIVFNALVSPRVHLLEREFSFGKWTLLAQVSGLIGTLFTIVLAYYLRSVWAIVLGTVAERFLYCLFSYILYPFLPKLDIDKKSISELFKFARGIFGLSVLNLIARQADVFVLAKVVTPAILGSYYLATQLAEQPASFFANTVARVLLPSFSRIKENKSKLKNVLLSVNETVATYGIPISVFLAANSFLIVSILYGTQYTNAALALSLLFLNIFARIQIMLLTQTYYGLGLPHLHRLQSLKRVVLIVVLIYPSTILAGLFGAALVMLLANAAMFVFQLYRLKEIVCLMPTEYFSKWTTGVGLGVLVFIPNVFLWFFNIDTLIIKIVFTIGTITPIILYGFIKLRKELTS